MKNNEISLAIDLGYLQGLKTAMAILRTHGHALPDIASVKLLGLIQALQNPPISERK